MPRRRPPRETPDQLELATSAPSAAAAPTRKPPVHLKPPDELARIVVAKSYKLDASGKLRVPLTLFFARAFIARLHERPIREGTTLATMVQELLEREVGR